MRGLNRRIEALEHISKPGLSPKAKAWLGWPLTEAEQQALDAGEALDNDTSTISPEARAWLGIN